MQTKKVSYDKLPKLLAILKSWHTNGRFDWEGSSYIKGVNDVASETLLGKIMGRVRIEALPVKSQTSDNADTHFTVPHDQLDGQYSAEWEGITWGWQDCINKIDECLPDIAESIYKDTIK